MELARRLVVWACLVVGVSVVTLIWRPITDKGSWLSQIDHGELILVAIAIHASAVGYAAIAPSGEKSKTLKTIVIAPGTVILILSVLVYSSFVQGPSPSAHGVPSAQYIADISYVLFVAALLIGMASMYLTYKSEGRETTP